MGRGPRNSKASLIGFRWARYRATTAAEIMSVVEVVIESGGEVVIISGADVVVISVAKVLFTNTAEIVITNGVQVGSKSAAEAVIISGSVKSQAGPKLGSKTGPRLL